MDDHPGMGPHRLCTVDHGGRGVREHCRRGCKWPCPEANIRAIRLRYPATCIECDERMQPGTVVRYNQDDDLQHHPDCPEPTAPGPLCPRCALLHLGEC